MIAAMNPGLILLLLVACVVALMPVWRLHQAGWPSGTLLWIWIGYVAAIFIAVRIPGPARFLLPVIILAFVAPFVAGPERLSRVLHLRRQSRRPIIDVTPRPATDRPRPAPGLPQPPTEPRNVTPDVDDDAPPR